MTPNEQNDHERILQPNDTAAPPLAPVADESAGKVRDTSEDVEVEKAG